MSSDVGDLGCVACSVMSGWGYTSGLRRELFYITSIIPLQWEHVSDRGRLS